MEVPMEREAGEQESNHRRLDGRVALVAGGAGGMGSAVARRFAADGARVAVADYRLEAAETVAAELTGAGSEAMAVPLDVTEPDAWQAAVEQVESRFGSLTTMCYLAGGNHRVSYDEMTVAQFRRILELNLTGIFIGIKAVVPAMRRAGGGCIISVGSLASLRAGGGAPAYTCSKFGVSALTAATAGSYARDGIRCCQVNPGHVDTPFIPRLCRAQSQRLVHLDRQPSQLREPRPRNAVGTPAPAGGDRRGVRVPRLRRRGDDHRLRHHRGRRRSSHLKEPVPALLSRRQSQELRLVPARQCRVHQAFRDSRHRRQPVRTVKRKWQRRAPGAP